VAQDQRRPVLGPHAFQGAVEFLAALLGEGGGLGVTLAAGREREVGELVTELPLLPALLPPAGTQTGVYRDLVEPGKALSPLNLSMFRQTRIQTSWLASLASSAPNIRKATRYTSPE